MIVLILVLLLAGCTQTQPQEVVYMNVDPVSTKPKEPECNHSMGGNWNNLSPQEQLKRVNDVLGTVPEPDQVIIP